jgi:hypothetical protein
MAHHAEKERKAPVGPSSAPPQRYHLVQNATSAVPQKVPQQGCRCFTATPTKGYLRGGEFVGRVSPRSGTRRCKEHKV